MANDWVNDPEMVRPWLLHMAKVGVLYLLGLFASMSVAQWLGWSGNYGIGSWVCSVLIVAQILILKRGYPRQGRPFLIRWAAGMVLILALGAIFLACPIIVSHRAWWAAPLLVLLTAKLVLVFGRVCEWTASLPREPAKRMGGGPPGGVEDHWVDFPS
jgi:hypothetical protein